MFGIDDALLGAGLSAGANLLGGLFGSSGAQASNAQQIAASQQQAQFNAHQADIARQDQWAQNDMQRKFMYEFSGSAYQRAAGDLEKAGLNRILALGSPASSAPGGIGSSPAGSGSGPGALQNPGAHLAQGISSAGQAGALYAQINQTKAMTDKDNAQTSLNKATEKLTEKQGEKTDQDTATSKSAENLNNAAIVNKAWEGALMRANANSADALARVNNRIADDTAAYGDSPWSKAVGGFMRMFNTGKHLLPNSAATVPEAAPAAPPLNPSTGFIRRRYGGQ